MVLNGSLAGLVGITAGADTVGVMSAIIIGFVAGIIVVASVLGLDRAKLDDPVGAISVHLVCGMWGTLAVGIFSTNAGALVPDAAHRRPRLRRVLLRRGVRHLLRAQGEPSDCGWIRKRSASASTWASTGMEAYGGFQINQA